MQQPSRRARDERLELPGPAGVLQRLPITHRPSPTVGARTRVRRGPVSYEARVGPTVKSRAPRARGGYGGCLREVPEIWDALEVRDAREL
ncbi:MAG: hypothetical protein JF597_19960 [Streptomyces sp.]|nr:hypothetical protein [Streptomyces sp.]